MRRTTVTLGAKVGLAMLMPFLLAVVVGFYHVLRSFENWRAEVQGYHAKTVIDLIATRVRFPLQLEDDSRIQKEIAEIGRASAEIARIRISTMDHMVIAEWPESAAGLRAMTTMVVTRKVSWQRRHLGFVELAMDRSRFDSWLEDQVAELRVQAFLASCILAVLAIVVALWLRRRFSALRDVMRQVARGDFSSRAPEGSDEIGVLGQTFNTMAAQVDASKQELIEARNEALRHAEIAERANQSKNDFLANVSHELRTPITNIRSFAELLLTYDDDDTRDEFLGIISTESDRLTRMVTDLLDLAKIEAGVLCWEHEELDIGDVATRAVQGFRGAEVEQDVALHAVLPDEPVSFRGDADRLQQLLVNLIGNAIKFSPRGSSVRFEMRLAPSAVEISVADRGPGVPGVKAKESIFEKFTQMGKVLTDKPKGTGLGLTLCKEIVLAHHGTIACHDNPGGGALFVVRLPRLGASCAPSPQQPSVDDVPTPPSGSLVPQSRVR